MEILWQRLIIKRDKYSNDNIAKNIGMSVLDNPLLGGFINRLEWNVNESIIIEIRDFFVKNYTTIDNFNYLVLQQFNKVVEQFIKQISCYINDYHKSLLTKAVKILKLNFSPSLLSNWYSNCVSDSQKSWTDSYSDRHLFLHKKVSNYIEYSDDPIYKFYDLYAIICMIDSLVYKYNEKLVNDIRKNGIKFATQRSKIGSEYYVHRGRIKGMYLLPMIAGKEIIKTIQQLLVKDIAIFVEERDKCLKKYEQDLQSSLQPVQEQQNRYMIIKNEYVQFLGKIANLEKDLKYLQDYYKQH